MIVDIEQVLKQKNILYHSNQGIKVCSVQESDALDLALAILYAATDPKTALYLSGGKTPKELYKRLATEELLMPGAVLQVDERFGPPYHANSNQKMMRETGLLRYFEMRDIPFYPMLQLPSSLRAGEADDDLRKKTAELYDEKIRSLNATFQKSVAVLGIGADGHTAGLPAQSSKLKMQNSKLNNKYDLVTEYIDTSGKYGERVTMTFVGLSMMDVLLVLVFGADKKEALEQMFQSGSEQEIPARFYKRPEIARKTILITDQAI